VFRPDIDNEGVIVQTVVPWASHADNASGLGSFLSSAYELQGTKKQTALL
jgi:hypothetical protein